MSTRIEIVNPFIKHKGSAYQCFGCSPYNSNGLHMKFYIDNNDFYGEFMPNRAFEGYKEVVHGGIQATLMDEAASWYVYSQIGTAGVTKSMNVEYLSPTRITDEPLLVKIKFVEQNDNEVSLLAELSVKDKITAKATIVYFTFPEAVAKSRYYYPGKEAFYNQN